MALIHCPECGREISDKASACPGCGYPIAPDSTASTNAALEAARERDKKFLKQAGLVLLLGIIAILLFAWFCGRAA